MKRRSILFISESIPYDSYGSHIVFFRHLQRFEQQGWEINLIIPDYKNFESKSLLPSTWNVQTIPFPSRRWWYPPYRFNIPILRNIRYRLLYSELKKFIDKSDPQFIIGYFYAEYLAGFCGFVAKKKSVELGMFFHDDFNFIDKIDSRIAKAKLLFYEEIADNADHIWTVSEKLIFKNHLQKHKLVYPIPAGYQAMDGSNAPVNKPVIGFSGKIGPNWHGIFKMILEALKVFDGELHVITDNFNAVKDLLPMGNLKIIPFFNHSHEAMDYLNRNVNMIFAGYPDDFDEMPWLRNCFPSKFVEFVHLKLPVITTAPEGSYFREWSFNNHWTTFIKDYDKDAFIQIIENLMQPEFRAKTIEQVTYFANNQFNPIAIHESLLKNETEDFKRLS